MALALSARHKLELFADAVASNLVFAYPEVRLFPVVALMYWLPNMLVDLG